MKAILNFRHWQLFIIMVLPMYWVSPEPLKTVVNLLSVVFFTWWFYSIIHYGQQLANQYNKNVVFVIFLFPLNLLPLTILSEYTSAVGFNFINSVYLMLVLLELYLGFYIYYKVAEIIYILEKHEKPTFAKIVPTILMLIFNFIGIWFLQPKINKIFALVADNRRESN